MAANAVCAINVKPIASGCVVVIKIVLIMIIIKMMVKISENSLFKIVTLEVIDA
jgi:hypothetical protein